MSDVLIASLQKRVEELTGELANLRAASKDRQIKGKAVAAELQRLKAEAATVAGERDGSKLKAEARPGEEAARIAELEGQLTARDHRDAFAHVKEFAGADGKKYQFRDGVDVELLWRLTGYKAEGAPPAAQVVSGTLAEAAQAHPYLFTEVATPAPPGASRPQAVSGREPGPGVGKPGSPTLTSVAGGVRSPRDGLVPGRI